MIKFKLNRVGNVPALRVIDQNDFSLMTPNIMASYYDTKLSIAAIIHVFYPELMSEIADCLNNFEVVPDIFISTDSQEKAEVIKEFCLGYKNWNVVIEIVNNRGRDVAPMIVDFKDVFDKYEYCIHLHTKKTKHNSAVANWRKYLFYTLCGTKEIVASNIGLLMQNQIGFVYAQNINVYRHNLSWGKRFDNVKQLLAKSNISLYPDNLLEFPTSTMFYAKTNALKKLLEQNLLLEDFEIENKQLTATLAHDIETSLLYFVESNGYKWIKVSNNHGNIIQLRNKSELSKFLQLVPQLLYRHTDEYNKLLEVNSKITILVYIKNKLFNLWQKITFKTWHAQKPYKWQIKNIEDI